MNLRRKEMKPRYALFLTLLLAVLAFGFGYRSYTATEGRITADLNQAVRRTVLQQRELCQQPDTLQAYRSLTRSMGAPVTVSGANPAFAQALTLEALRGRAVLTIHAAGTDDAEASVIPDGCLASDTVLWMLPEADGAILTFRGYAHCSPWFILRHSDQTAASLFLLAALLCLSYGLRRRKPSDSPAGEAADDSLITFGNLSLSQRDDCFYNEQHERLHLTPMQYALMEMFYLNDEHRLTKPHICRSLWPGKDNADETLYTLIRRLKPIVEENSNLHITSDRGRAYLLEVNE